MAGISRYTIVFTGRVQGVGFRYTTLRIAQRFPDGSVTGWVRNEPDGSVRCVAEGKPDQLDRFLSEVQDAMSGNIRDVQIDRTAGLGEFDSFEIRY